MKKITLIMLILFGIGLTTHQSNASKPTACPGLIHSSMNCTYNLCMSYIDCAGNPKVVCVVLPPGGTLSFNAITGGCCLSITNITIQLVGGGAPVSGPVTPGSVGVYISGVVGPCNKTVIDYSTNFPDCILHP
jgi:hypothetical protein